MATELDRLFREKLDQLEVKPSAQSWEVVRTQITSQKTGWWTPLRVAACVTLVLAGGLSLYLLPKSQPLQNELAVLADHPAVEEAMAWEWHIPLRQEAPPVKAHGKQPAKKPAPAPKIVNKENHWQLVAVAPLAPKPLEVEAPNLPVLNHLNAEKEQPAIKIRYIAATEDADETRLNDVLEKLREVDAGALLADFRDAKKSLFDRN